jgi:hypothetical protein
MILVFYALIHRVIGGISKCFLLFIHIGEMMIETSICSCSAESLSKSGTTVHMNQTWCNSCGRLAPRGTQVKSEKVNSKSSVPSKTKNRLSGINGIIRRMWWWIGIQAIFIGIWAGSAFPTEDYYGPSFSFGMFFVGILFGVGAFAPLVFVVEALREVVINLGGNASEDEK